MRAPSRCSFSTTPRPRRGARTPCSAPSGVPTASATCRATCAQGFKAGALAHGLAHSDALLVAVFDVDFRPPPDTLRRLVPALVRDPGLAFVQAVWTHPEGDATALGRAQAAILDLHFAVEQTARDRARLPLVFNGTAGVWRVAAIEDAGGWQGDTLAEDIDLALRAQAGGWWARLAEHVRVPADLPPTVGAWRRQQARWAKGLAEVARKDLGRVWRSALGLRARLAATAHMALSLSLPSLLAVIVLHPFVAASQAAGVGPGDGAYALLGVGYVALAGLIIAHVVAQHALYPETWTRRWTHIVLALVTPLVLVVPVSRAVWEAARGRRTPFLRTPKDGRTPGRGDAGRGGPRLLRDGGGRRPRRARGVAGPRLPDPPRRRARERRPRAPPTRQAEPRGRDRDAHPTRGLRGERERLCTDGVPSSTMSDASSPTPEPAIQVAARLLAEGQPAQAVERLAALVAEAPTYAAAHVLHATALEADGHVGAALVAWSQAAALVPRSPLVHRERERLLAAHRPPPEDADAELPPAVPLTPSLPVAEESVAEEPPPFVPDAQDPLPVIESFPLDAFAPTAAEDDDDLDETSDDVDRPPSLDEDGPSPLDASSLFFGDPFTPAPPEPPDPDPPAAPEPEPMPPSPPPPASPLDLGSDAWNNEPLGESELLPPEGAAPADATIDLSDTFDASGWTVLSEDDIPTPPPDARAEPDVVAPEGEIRVPPEGFSVADELDSLIAQLEDAPRIRPDPEFNGPEVSFGDEDVEEVASETLAKIYAAQHQYVQAALIYEKLAARQPDQAEEMLRRAAEMRERG